MSGSIYRVTKMISRIVGHCTLWKKKIWQLFFSSFSYSLTRLFSELSFSFSFPPFFPFFHPSLSLSVSLVSFNNTKGVLVWQEKMRRSVSSNMFDMQRNSKERLKIAGTHQNSFSYQEQRNERDNILFIIFPNIALLINTTNTKIILFF